MRYGLHFCRHASSWFVSAEIDGWRSDASSEVHTTIMWSSAIATSWIIELNDNSSGFVTTVSFVGNKSDPFSPKPNSSLHEVKKRSPWPPASIRVIP